MSALVDAGRSTSLYRIQEEEEEGKNRLTSRVWARALDEEDALAGELFDLAVEMIGVGIGSVVNVLDLELVVIGGGLAEKLGQNLADRIAGAAAPWMLRPDPGLRFVAAGLGDDSGLVGAAALARALVVGGEPPQAGSVVARGDDGLFEFRDGEPPCLGQGRCRW